jgi:PTH1 family peptidyl-tRNA hydrolase
LFLITLNQYVNIKTEDILIISDDLDLPFGSIRLKEKGSSGGHNGLKNIENQLHTIEYKRLKLGISNNKEIDTKDYVIHCYVNFINCEDTFLRIKRCVYINSQKHPLQ